MTDHSTMMHFPTETPRSTVRACPLPRSTAQRSLRHLSLVVCPVHRAGHRRHHLFDLRTAVRPLPTAPRAPRGAGRTHQASGPWCRSPWHRGRGARVRARRSGWPPRPLSRCSRAARPRHGLARSLAAGPAVPARDPCRRRAARPAASRPAGARDARGGDGDTVLRAFGAGADDVTWRGVGYPLLRARLRALLAASAAGRPRRSRGSATTSRSTARARRCGYGADWWTCRPRSSRCLRR
jgi:hypothetical protein